MEANQDLTRLTLNSQLFCSYAANNSSCAAAGHQLCCYTGLPSCLTPSGCSCEHNCYEQGNCCPDIVQTCRGRPFPCG